MLLQPSRKDVLYSATRILNKIRPNRQSANFASRRGSVSSDLYSLSNRAAPVKTQHALIHCSTLTRATMVKKEELVDKQLFPFATAKQFEDYLDDHHKTLPAVYIKLAKKASGIPSITLAEAIEVALCFGWIDGSGCTLDGTWWTTRFLPRRPKSMWSKKNVDTVGRLIEQGRMRPDGLAAVEAAKQDGRWDRAYAGPSTITEPEDFNLALDANAAAKETYVTLNKTERYSVLWKIETASPKARFNRIQAQIQMLADGKKPPRPGAKAASKPTHVVDKVVPSKPNKVVKTTRRKNGDGTVKSVSNTSGEHSSASNSTSKQKPSTEPRQPRRSGLRARS